MLLDCIRERGCIVADGLNREGNLLVKPVEFSTDLIDGKRLLCFLPSGADLISLGFAEPRELGVALHVLQEIFHAGRQLIEHHGYAAFAHKPLDRYKIVDDTFDLGKDIDYGRGPPSPGGQSLEGFAEGGPSNEYIRDWGGVGTLVRIEEVTELGRQIRDVLDSGPDYSFIVNDGRNGEYHQCEIGALAGSERVPAVGT